MLTDLFYGALKAIGFTTSEGKIGEELRNNEAQYAEAFDKILTDTNAALNKDEFVAIASQAVAAGTMSLGALKSKAQELGKAGLEELAHGAGFTNVELTDKEQQMVATSMLVGEEAHHRIYAQELNKRLETLGENRTVAEIEQARLAANKVADVASGVTIASITGDKVKYEPIIENGKATGMYGNTLNSLKYAAENDGRFKAQDFIVARTNQNSTEAQTQTEQDASQAELTAAVLGLLPKDAAELYKLAGENGKITLTPDSEAAITLADFSIEKDGVSTPVRGGN